MNAFLDGLLLAVSAFSLVPACGASYLVHLADATGPFVPASAEPKPPRGVWQTNEVFGTAYVRVTDVAADGIGQAMASVVYSRWSPLSSSGEFLYFQRAVGGADGLIYDAHTRTLHKVLPEQIAIDGVPGQPFHSMESAEIRWDQSGRWPQRFYYVAGPRFYAYDLATDAARLVHDFSVPSEFPGAEMIHNNVEGDASADSRYWAWMVRGPDEGFGAPVLALITYDQEEDRIVGQFTVEDYRRLGGHYRTLPLPNMVEVAPSGRRMIYHLGRCWGETGLAADWTPAGGAVYWTHLEGVEEPLSRVEEDGLRDYLEEETLPSGPGTFFHDRPARRLYVWCFDGADPASHTIAWEYGHRPRDAGTWFDGPHAWTLEFGQPVKVAVDETHSGWAWSYEGRELFVSQNNRNDWIEACDMETGTTLQVMYQGDFGWGNGWHFARMPSSTPGWILMSTYREGANTDWGDNQLFMLEMRAAADHPRVWRLGPTHNTYDEYYAEGFAAMSPGGDRLWWGAKWPGQTNIEAYEMRLPAQWWVDLAGGPRLFLTCRLLAAEGLLELRWPSTEQRRYTVHASARLPGGFEVVSSHLPAQPPTNVLTLPLHEAAARFFQIIEEP